jgi:hypothetical protein
MALSQWDAWWAHLTNVAKLAAQEPYGGFIARDFAAQKSVTYDDEQHFKNSFAKLSDFARTIIQEEATAEMVPGDVVPNFASVGYWIVECADGETPKLKNMKTLVALAKYLSSADGKDVYVFPLYGIALPVTKGPQRYLYLPDGATAVTIPVVKNGAVTEVDTEVLRDTVKMQADYYFGPIEMITSVTFKEDKKPAVRQQPKPPLTDDDFDD